MASDAQDRVYELLARPAAEGAAPFSHFDAADAGRADQLADELSSIAAADGVDAAITRAYEVADEGSLGIAKYALKIFVTHDDESASALTIPSPQFTNSEPLPPVQEQQAEEG